MALEKSDPRAHCICLFEFVNNFRLLTSFAQDDRQRRRLYEAMPGTSKASSQSNP